MRPHLILILAPATLALATLAQAQPAGPPRAAMNARHEAMQKQHIEDLKTVLRLRPDQEPALAAFVDAHRPPGEERKAPREPGAPTTPQRLEEMSKHEAAMAAQHQRMRDALAKFYGALTPEQRQVFDALQRLKGPRGGPMMMRGGPGGGHGGPRVLMRGHGGPDGPTPGHEPPR